MTNPMEFFMSVDVSLSDKLLEILYFVIGLIAIYVAIRNLNDKNLSKAHQSVTRTTLPLLSKLFSIYP